MQVRGVLASLLFLVSFQFIGHAINVPVDSVSETKTIAAFTVLKIQGNFNVVLSPGTGCSLKVTADKATMPSVDVKNSGTSLIITMKDGATGGATLYIGMKEIIQISINTTGTISCAKEIKTDDLSLSLEGNVEGTLMLNIKMLTLNTKSDKNLVLKGKSKKSNAKLAGDGNIDMSALQIDDLMLDNSCDADVKIFAHPDLHVKMSGAGTLTYYGNPRVKVFTVHGNGQVVEGK
jgi:hypothetical protein